MKGFISAGSVDLRIDVLIPAKLLWNRIDRNAEWDEKARHILQAQLLEDLGSGIKVRCDGTESLCREKVARFLRRDDQGVYYADDRDNIPLADALVGVTLVFKLPSQVDAAVIMGSRTFELEWGWFPRGQTGVNLEIEGRDSAMARDLSSKEPRITWNIERDSSFPPQMRAVPAAEWSLRYPLHALLYLGLALLVLASGLVVRRKMQTPKWVWVIFALGIALMTIALRYRVNRASLPKGESKESLIQALLYNSFRAVDSYDEASSYDLLSRTTDSKLLEIVYQALNSSLAEEGEEGIPIKMKGFALDDFSELRTFSSQKGGFLGTAEWTVTGEATRWGTRFEYEIRYKALIGLVADEREWKIGKFDMIRKEKTQNIVHLEVVSEKPTTEAKDASAGRKEIRVGKKGRR